MVHDIKKQQTIYGESYKSETTWSTISKVGNDYIVTQTVKHYLKPQAIIDEKNRANKNISNIDNRDVAAEKSQYQSAVTEIDKALKI